jgi:hypothetical protein
MQILRALVLSMVLGGLVVMPVAAEEGTGASAVHRSAFYGTVVSYTAGPGGRLVARARRVGDQGGGVETFQITDTTTFGERAPQVDDGVAVVWKEGSNGNLVAVRVYAIAGGLPSAAATPVPTRGASVTSTPAATETPRHRAFYGTVTSFTAPGDDGPGSLSAQAIRPEQDGTIETFQVTRGTKFEDAMPNVGDGVAISWEGDPSSVLVARLVYVRSGGFQFGAASPTATAQSEVTYTTPTPVPVAGTPAPWPPRRTDDPISTEPHAAAGVLVAYVAPEDSQDGAIAIRLPRSQEGGHGPIETFLVGADAHVLVNLADGAASENDPVALTWTWQDGQREVIDLTIG